MKPKVKILSNHYPVQEIAEIAKIYTKECTDTDDLIVCIEDHILSDLDQPVDWDFDDNNDLIIVIPPMIEPVLRISLPDEWK